MCKSFSSSSFKRQLTAKGEIYVETLYARRDTSARHYKPFLYISAPLRPKTLMSGIKAAKRFMINLLDFEEILYTKNC